MVPELADPSVRELLIGNSRLIYEVQERYVYILALIHGARDLAAPWKRETRSKQEESSAD